MPLAPSSKKRDLVFPHYSEGKLRVFCGDCLNVLPMLMLANGRQRYELIFGDCPFNIGQEYHGFVDQIPNGEYRIFTRKWVNECCEHLAPNGVLCLHGPDALVELYLKIMEQRPQLRRVAWINWHYRFGQCNFNNWIDSRCHCLIYSAGNYIWNPQDVLVDSDRLSKYGDKRCANSKYGGKRVPFTIWGIPSDGPGWGRVTGARSNAERRPLHPNQLPCNYLRRLVLAYTNQGSKILDVFSGSGTLISVAKELGRGCDAIELSSEYCDSIVERVKETKASKP